MNSQDFRLKYRPKKFAEFVGNKLPIEILKEIIRSQRIPNGILFHGPPGSGKTSLAEVFSKAYYCLDYSGDACGICKNCSALNKIFSEEAITLSGGIITDCTRIGGRNGDPILATTFFSDPPVEKGRRIRILDEFDKAQKTFQEKLLRILEFQYNKWLFIFCLIDLNKVSKPFRQRVTVLKTSQPELEELIPWLKEKCGSENITVRDNNALKQLALAANGLPRECLSLLQTISYLNSPLTTSLVKEVIRGIRGTDDDMPRYKITDY